MEMSLAADEVAKNAAEAWQTAGMSANQYMENVTGFAAGLIQSLGGNTRKAAEIADMAIIDMSDNANKMGTDIGMLQNAYQGFARQQYQMLDNLKLGYGGTKTEMERLLADASKISGIRYDISNLSDVYSAIHVIQQELGITGTTAEEAASTLTGSFAAVKATLTNLLGGMGGGMDMSGLFDNLMDAFDTFFSDNLTPMIINFFKSIPSLVEGFMKDGFQKAMKNLGNDIGKIAASIVTGLTSMAVKLNAIGPLIIGQIIAGLFEALPEMISSFGEMAQDLAEYFPQLAVVFVEQIPQIISAIVAGLIKSIPALINALGDIIAALVQAIPPMLASLADAFSGLGSQIVTALAPIGNDIVTAFAPAVNQVVTMFTPIAEAIQGAFQELLPSVQNLFDSIGQFASACVGLISTIFAPIGNFLGTIFDAAVDRIKDAFGGVISFLRNIGQQMLAVFRQIASQFADIGRQIVENLKQGFVSAWENLVSAIKQKIDALASLFTGLTNTVSNATSMINGNLNSISNKARYTSGTVSTNLRSTTMSAPAVYSLNAESADNSYSTQSQPVNVNVTLSGSAKAIFDSVRVENEIQQNATGYAALA